MIPATTSATHIGQPKRASTMVASKNRFTPAISSCASAKEMALTKCAPLPKRRRMNSGTERTFEP